MTNTLFEETCEVRDGFYSKIGVVDQDVMTHLINPSFMGGPDWPALRQAFSIIHRDNSTIIISNGLSDPFNDLEEVNTGFGIEIYAETKGKIEGDILDSSLFKLVYATAQQAAHSGQIADYVKKYGTITMELDVDDSGLHGYENDNGMVGIMIGIEHPELPKTIDFPGGDVVLATVQILTKEELDFVVEARAEGRNSLHQRFKDSGVYHFISTHRQSLIETANTKNNAITSSNKRVKPWWKIW